MTTPGSSDAPASLRLTVDDRPGEGDERRRERQWDQMLADLTTMTDELVDDVSGLEASAAAVASLCPGWTVRDVVVHLAVGDRLALRVLQGENPFGEMSADDAFLDATAASLASELDRMTMGAALERFRATREQLLATAGRVLPEERRGMVPWAAKPIGRFALLQSRVMETWVHGWDLRWTLEIPQVIDDRAWWVADIGVRHSAYALRKQDRPVPPARLRVELAGAGGGSWTRDLVPEPAETIDVRGPAWAWITWVARRHPSAVSRLALATSTGEGAEDVVASARCYA